MEANPMHVPKSVMDLENAAQLMEKGSASGSFEFGNKFNGNKSCNSGSSYDIASAIFTNLKTMEQAIPLCKTALETSHNDFVLFQCLEGISFALFKQWDNEIKNELDVDTIISYIFSLMNEQKFFKPYVFNQLSRMYGLICKKSIVMNQRKNKTDIDENAFLRNVLTVCFDGITSISVQNTTKNQYATILKNILREIENVKNITSLGVSLKDHHECKKSFQTKIMPSLFQKFNHLIKTIVFCAPESKEAVNPILLKELLLMVENILNWDFSSSSNVYSNIESISDSPVFCPGYEFYPAMFADDEIKIPWFYFQVFENVRHSEDLGVPVLGIIEQISSLNGPVLIVNHLEKTFLTDLLQIFITWGARYANADVGWEIQSVTRAIKKLCLFYYPDTFAALEPEICAQFVEFLTNLTICFGTKSLSENDGVDPCLDTPYSFAYCDLLTSWGTIMMYYRQNFLPLCDTEKFLEQCYRILQCFVHVKISAPLGGRKDSDDYVSGEIDELEENDDERYEEELKTIAELGRTSAKFSFGYLSKFEMAIMQKFFSSNSWKRESSLSMKIAEEADENVQLYMVFEDLCWILRIINSIIFPLHSDEGNVVPNEVNTLYTEIDEMFDTELTKQYFSSCFNAKVDFPQVSAVKIEPLIGLAGPIFKFISVIYDEEKSVEPVDKFRAKLDFLSPALVTGLLQFLVSWIKTYIRNSDSSERYSNPVYSELFEKNEDAVNLQCECALSFGIITLMHWRSETDITKEAVKVISTVCLKNWPAIVHSRSLGDLVNEMAIINPNSLPVHLIGSDIEVVFSAFVSAVETLSDEKQALELWQRVMAICSFYLNIAQGKANETVNRTGAMLLLNSIIGIVNSPSRHKSFYESAGQKESLASKSVSDFIQHLTNSLPQLFEGVLHELVVNSNVPIFETVTSGMFRYYCCVCEDPMLMCSLDALLPYANNVMSFILVWKANILKFQPHSKIDKENFYHSVSRQLADLFKILLSATGNLSALKCTVQTQNNAKFEEIRKVILFCVTQVVVLINEEMLLMPHCAREYFILLNKIVQNMPNAFVTSLSNEHLLFIHKTITWGFSAVFFPGADDTLSRIFSTVTLLACEVGKIVGKIKPPRNECNQIEAIPNAEFYSKFFNELLELTQQNILTGVFSSSSSTSALSDMFLALIACCRNPVKVESPALRYYYQYILVHKVEEKFSAGNKRFYMELLGKLFDFVETNVIEKKVASAAASGDTREKAKFDNQTKNSFRIQVFMPYYNNAKLRASIKMK